MKTLGREQLKEMMAKDKDFLLVNVLLPKQFNQEHIPGSVNIPVNDENFEQKFEEKAESKDRKIVVYCASFDCKASPNAAERLEKLGYKEVYDYQGGIKDWKEASYPVESS
ncbi:MAG: rhodanese-like domain-containing protein [Desulfurivibrionaceae bacterium]